MANAAPTSSARSIVLSEVVAIEPSNEMMASCPDQACAPPAAVGGAKSTFTCTTVSASEIAPSVSSQEMHCLVTAVSSDDSATEVASAPADNPAIQEGNVPPVVHHPSASASAAGIASAPGKTHEMSVNNSAGISTAISSDDAITEVASAPTTDDPAVQEETVPPVVPPSTSNDTIDGTVSAPGKSHDMPVKSSTDTPIATCSEESTTVVEKTVSLSTNVGVGHIVHHPASGAVHTTATEVTAPSPTVTVCLSTTEVEGNMSNHIQDASTATAPVEVVADQMPLAKKRKCEKKATVPKDPDAPKKNLTAYMHYATYARAYLKPRNPNMKGSDVTVIVRRGWDAMSAQERNYWNEKAAADKERYETDLAEYKKSDLGVAWQARLDRERKQVTSDSTFDIYAGTKKASVVEQSKKYSDAPKPFVSAFMHYDAYARDHIKSKYPQMEDAEVKNVVQRGWNAITTQERVYWDGVAADDRLRYMKELSNAPKPNLSAYMHYDAYARDYIIRRHPLVEFAEVAKAVQRGWNAMTTQERTYWDGVAAADKERYQKDLACFKDSEQVEEQQSSEVKWV